VKHSGTPAALPELVRAARRRRGWTRETLAHHTGLSWSAISQIETGRRTDIRISSLAALAEALGVSIDYLVGRGPTPLLRHLATIYESEEELAACAETFLREGIDAGHALLVVSTEDHIRLIKKALGPDARRVSFHKSSGWLTTPAEAVSRFETFITDAVAAGAPWVTLVGEPIWHGHSPADTTRWIRFESTINLALAALPVNALCPYDGRALPPDILAAAQHTHPLLVANNTTAESPSYEEPAGFVTA
jgi:transcriptional regulator with XRE-family HTH domain